MPVKHELAASVLTDLLFEERGVGRCLIAPDGSVVRANSEWLRSTGSSLDDVLGADIISLFPDTRDMALAMHARARAGHSVELPRHARWLHGRETWWEGSIAPVPMEGGMGLLITAREVAPGISSSSPVVLEGVAAQTSLDAGSCRSASELAASEARLRAVFDASNDAVILADPRDGGRVLRANPAACRMFGYTEEEFRGLTRDAMLDRDDPALPGLLITRRSVGHARAELIYRRKDGTRFTGDVSTALFTEPSGVPRAVAVIRDVTERKRADEALRASEALLRAVFDSMRDEVWFVDASRKLSLANPAVVREFLLPDGTLDAEKLASSCEVLRADGTPRPPDEAPPFRALRGEVLDSVQETVRTPATGELRHRAVSAAPVLDASGRIIGSVSVVRDVTEQVRAEIARKRAEEAAGQSQAALQAFYDSAPFMMGLVELHGDDVIVVHGNARVAALFGVDPGDIPGRPRTAIPPDPDIKLVWSRACRESHDSGAPVRFEYQHRGLGGVAWFSATAAPVSPGPSGHPRCCFVAEDITDRRRREEALRQSEERFRALVLASSDVVYRMSPDWSEMWHLQGRDFVADTDAPTATWLQKYIHPDDQPQVMAVIDEAIRTRTTCQLEHRVLRVDGTLGWTFSRAIPLFDANGDIVEWFGTASDVTGRKLAEQNLHDVLRRYEKQVRLFDGVASTTPDFVYLFDLQGRFLYANRRLLEVWGMKLEDVVGKTCRELGYEPWHHDMHMREIAQVIESKQPVKGEVPFKAPLTGIFGVYEYIFTPVIGPDGNVETIAATTRDVTERKRAEAALREKEQQLRMATTAANIGVWSWIPGTSEVVVSSNWRELFGVAAHEGVTFETWRDALHPEDRDRAVRELNQAAAAHREFNTEYRVVQPDGTVRWIVDRGRASYDGEGRPVMMGGVNVDITDRKHTEEELAVVTRLYAVLSRVNEVIVRIHDERSLYEAVCRIVADHGGFPLVWVGLVRGREVAPAAAAGRARGYVREVKVETDGELGQGPTGTCIREDRPLINEDFDTNPSTRPWRDTISKYGLRASAAFPLHRGGEVIGALTFYAARPGAFTSDQVKLLEALCADVSYALDSLQHERRRAEVERALRDSEQNLREADRRKTEFLAVLSHELRNPLAPIRNSLYLLEHAPGDSERSARAREIIQRQTEHLTRLVDDLLDVTRIERGKIELQRSRVDARDVVRRTCDDHRRAFQLRGVQLHVETSDPVWIDADETRLAQVIGNLLQNAAKFSRQGGTTTVSVRPVDGRAEIRVADDGAGIARDLLPRIFEPFVQADGGLARTAGGLGLGLALVKGLAELHGGSVSARSEGLGRGAEFLVAFPLSPPPAPKGSAPGPNVANRSMSILVIEDNVDAAASIAEVLEMEGHRVHVATHGASGIASAREVRPDVVLCDIGLPDVDGYQIARTLRADPTLEATRLIALSGYALPEDRRRAKEAGFDAHVAKPPSIGALLASLAGHKAST